MGDIDRIVAVTITRQTSTPSVASFSDVLIASEFLSASITPAFSGRVRTYGSLSELVAAGFTSGTDVYKAAAKVFGQNPSINRVFVGRKKTGGDGSETWDAALAAMQLENGAWYGLICTTRLLADQQDIADWVEANKKLCILGTSDVNTITGTGDIGDYVHTNLLERTAVIYHPDVAGGTDPFPGAAWFGKLFPKAPGSATWAFKTLAGVPTYGLTETEYNTAAAKKVNTYLSIAGVGLTQGGWVGSGEYIDIIHGIDWLTAQIQAYVFVPLIQNDKVPFTDAGVQMIVSQLKAALESGVRAGLLDSYVVAYPAVADVSAIDKGNRLLPDVTFTAVLAGAIHKVEIAGVVTL